MLLCVDNSYYVGITNNLERRLSEHVNNAIKNCYTSSRLPVKLVYHAVFNDINAAIAFEKQVKRWSRKKKEALMKEDWKEIGRLAKNYTQFAQLGVSP